MSYAVVVAVVGLEIRGFAKPLGIDSTSGPGAGQEVVCFDRVDAKTVHSWIGKDTTDQSEC